MMIIIHSLPYDKPRVISLYKLNLQIDHQFKNTTQRAGLELTARTNPQLSSGAPTTGAPTLAKES